MLELLLGGFFSVVACIVIVRPWVALYVLPVAILFSPELVLAGSRDPGVSSTVFVALDDAISIGLVVHILWKKQITVHSSWWPVLLFLLVGSVATIIGIVEHTVSTPVLSFFWILKLAQYSLVGIFISIVMYERQKIHSAIVGFLTAGLLASVMFPIVYQPSRTTLPFMGPQESGVIGAMLSTFFLVLLLYSSYNNSMRYNVYLSISSLAGVGYTIFSGSRAAVFGLIVGVLYALLTQRHKLQHVKFFIGMSMISIIVFLGGVFISNPSLLRLVSTVEKLMVLDIHQMPSLSARLSKWTNSIQLWGNYPLLGVGMPIGWIDNWYIRVLTETGLIGLLAWLIAMTRFFRTFITFKSNTHADPFVTGVVGAGIVMAAAAMFGARYVTVNTAMLFWTFIGIALGIVLANDDAPSPFNCDATE